MALHRLLRRRHSLRGRARRERGEPRPARGQPALAGGPPRGGDQRHRAHHLPHLRRPGHLPRLLVGRLRLDSCGTAVPHRLPRRHEHRGRLRRRRARPAADRARQGPRQHRHHARVGLRRAPRRGARDARQSVRDGVRGGQGRGGARDLRLPGARPHHRRGPLDPRRRRSHPDPAAPRHQRDRAARRQPRPERGEGDRRGIRHGQHGLGRAGHAPGVSLLRRRQPHREVAHPGQGHDLDRLPRAGDVGDVRRLRQRGEPGRPDPARAPEHRHQGRRQLRHPPHEWAGRAVRGHGRHPLRRGGLHRCVPRRLLEAGRPARARRGVAGPAVPDVGDRIRHLDARQGRG